MYDLIFIPYRQLQPAEPVALIEKIACVNPPHASDIPWLLREEGIYLREPGAILIAWTKDRRQIYRAYWYDPRQPTPSTLPRSTPPPQIQEEIAEIEVGERRQNGIAMRLIRRIIIGA